MSHNYAKSPPAFVRDPWAWDYTRDRMENNTGVPYDQWQGKHFAGAAAMYKNVVKKYASNVNAGNLVLPKECVDCGNVTAHYVNDYVCKDCRDLIERAPTYAEASKTITNPGALDAIREQLAEALGHAKKDAKRITDNLKANEELFAGIERNSAPKVSRNYKSMGEDKLRRSITQLENNEGEAISKLKGENRLDHLEAALQAAQENNIVL